MDESIIVEARFESQGRIVPLSFTWQENRYQVSDLGRQWESAGERHFLVMIPSGEVFELAFLIPENQWRMRRTPNHFGGMTPKRG